MSRVIQKMDPLILIPYENQWVALTLNREKVIAANKNFKKLNDKLDKMGIKRDGAILHYVPSLDGYHSY